MLTIHFLTGVQKLLLGLFGLPTGLAMVVIAGGELFTGNTAFLTAATIEVCGDYVYVCMCMFFVGVQVFIPVFLVAVS